MERKSSKEYSVLSLVEGEKLTLRNLPSRTSSLKVLLNVNRKVVNRNCNKRKIETNQCQELTSSELRTEPRADRLQRTGSAHHSSWQWSLRQI